MAQTINEAAEQRERDRAIAELRAQRAAKAAELEKLDTRIEQLTDADFRQRLGDRKRSEMSIAERAETVRRVGVEQYLAIAW